MSEQTDEWSEALATIHHLATELAKTKQDLTRARSRARTKAAEHRQVVSDLRAKVAKLNAPWRLELCGYKSSARLWMADGANQRVALSQLVDQYLTHNLDKLRYFKNALQEVARTANGWTPLEPVKPVMPGQPYTDYSMKTLAAALDELHGPLQ